MACGLRRCSGKRGCIGKGGPHPDPSLSGFVLEPAQRPRLGSAPAGDLKAVPDDVMKLFKLFDMDGDDRLVRSELSQVLQELDHTYWTTKRIRALFRAADLDRDQFISWREFLGWIFGAGAEQQAIRDALPALEAKDADRKQARAWHMANLANADTVAALVPALEEATPFFKAGDLQEHEERLGKMRLPFKVTVSTLAGLTCTVDVTREQQVKCLCYDVAQRFKKKAYRVILVHEGGRLEPPTATLEGCGVVNSEVQLAAQFSEVNPLLELSWSEFVAALIHHKILPDADAERLRQQCVDGKLNEEECREKFSKRLASAMEAEEKRQEALAEARRREEEEKKRRAEEQERKRKENEERLAAICTKHRAMYETFAYTDLITQAANFRLIEDVKAVGTASCPAPQSATDELIQRVALVSARQACETEIRSLQEALSPWEATAGCLASEAERIKDRAQMILDRALPLLDSAVKELHRLSKRDIVEVNSIRKPPHALGQTCEAVCKLFCVRPEIKSDPDNPGRKIHDWWRPFCFLAHDSNKFMHELMEFDKDNIPAKVISQITDYVGDEACSPEVNAKCSKLGFALCLWVRAMYEYHFVCLEVDPMRAALRAAEAELSEAMMHIHKYQQQIHQQMTDADHFQHELESKGALTF